MFPPIPPWSGLHPPVVHLPIALLIVAPIFVLLSLAVPRLRQGFAASALMLMILGWLGASLAVLTGESAARFVQETPAISKVLHEHIKLAGITRAVFTLLIVLYGPFLAFPFYRDASFPRKLDLSLHAAFLAAYLGGMLLLANTADRGGHLVHVYGVHAVLAPSQSVEKPGAP